MMSALKKTGVALAIPSVLRAIFIIVTTGTGLKILSKIIVAFVIPFAINVTL